MNDLDAIRKCALRMGFTVRDFTAKSAVCYDVTDSAIVASNEKGGDSIYDPLNDDAQAMALVKRFNLGIYFDADEKKWGCYQFIDGAMGVDISSDDLNRAIVQCVANLP